jgi:hypothetical protein
VKSVQNWLISSLLVLSYIGACDQLAVFIKRRFALGQHFVIEGLLRARFGEIDQEIAGVIPRLMGLESDEYTRVLLNLSRSPLAQAELSELLVLP